MTINIDSHILYRSEYQPSYELTVDQHETSVGVGGGINNALLQIQEYCNKLNQSYLEKKRLIEI